MIPFTLRGDGLVLSMPTIEDIDRITEICQESDVQRWTTVPSPYRREDAEGFVTGHVVRGWDRGTATWAIRLVEDDAERLVGMIGLDGVRDGTGDLGYWLASESRGRGIMYAAVGLVVDAAFERLDLRRITWRAFVANWPSWRVVWRHGFRREGTLRGIVHRASRSEEWIGSLLRDDPRTPAHPWDGPVPVRAVEPGEAAAGAVLDPEAAVRRFHECFEVPVAADGARADRPRLGLRLDLVAEEFAELVEATRGPGAATMIRESWVRATAADEGARDTVGTADALGDLVYVLYGMALELGIPLPRVIAEIHRSNMSKLGGDGRPVLREDGKVLKGPGYAPPDLAGLLGETPPS